MSSSSPTSSTRLLLVIFAVIVLLLSPLMHRRSSRQPRPRHLQVLPRQAEKSTTISPTTPVVSTSSSRSPLLPLASPTQPPPSASDSQSTVGPSSSSSNLEATSKGLTSTSTSTFTSTASNQTTTSHSPSTALSSSSSPIRTPSLPAVPSPSRSTSRSSTNLVTSETSQVTLSSDPETSLLSPSNFSTTSVVQTFVSPLPVTTEPISSSSIGFLQHKGAVAGTFTVVALVLLGAIIAMVFFVVRKKQHATVVGDRGDSQFFTSLAPQPEMASRISVHTVSATGGHSVSTSPGPSFAELATQAPMDPNNNQYSTANYEYSYPFTALSSVREQEYSNDSVHGPTIPEPSSHSPHTSSTKLYYIPPPGRGAVPPVQNRKSVARTSYQPSIDSFYGAA